MLDISWDRELLEKSEARVLANNFKSQALLEKQLKVSEKYYGHGSAMRIRVYMRSIWKEELLK